MLFALNLVIYFWGNQKREKTVEGLRQAISRQALISGLDQSLKDIEKQVTLLSEIKPDTVGGAADAGEAAQFNAQLQKVERAINQLRVLAEPETLPNIDAFAEAYRKLGASWRIFHDNLIIDQTKAITELAVRAEPLAEEVILKRLPQLQADENKHVEAASENFYQVARLTDRTTILIFAISAAVGFDGRERSGGEPERGERSRPVADSRRRFAAGTRCTKRMDRRPGVWIQEPGRIILVFSGQRSAGHP